VPSFPIILLLLHLLTINQWLCWARTPTEIYEEDVIFREVIDGEVEYENFTYFIVKIKDDILLNLTSLVGDCDLYVSQARRDGENPPSPSIDTFSYDLQSSTCGQDVLFIGKDIMRPFSVGIYAHPSYSHCLFSLEIISTRPTDADYDSEIFSQEIHEDEPSHEASQEGHRADHNQKRHTQSNQKGSEFDSYLEILLNITIQFLGVIFEILL